MASLHPRIRNLKPEGYLVRELIRTNDRVLISFVEALLREAGIAVVVADTNMSVLEGMIGIFPQRVLVDEGRYDEACRILHDAELGHWVKGRD